MERNDLYASLSCRLRMQAELHTSFKLKMAQDMDVHYIYNNGTECEMQFKKGKQRETREKKDTELKNNAKKCSVNENK